MDPQKLIEISKIAQQIDKYDYYQILNIPRNANDEMIKTAFYKRSRAFHPDRYFSVGNEAFRGDVNTVYKRIAEAYAVIRNPKDREEYDKGIAGPDRENNLRFVRKAAEEEYDGGTGPGKRYYVLAKKAFNNLDYNSAKINIQLAMSMEADNEHFTLLQEKIEEKVTQKHKKIQVGNPHAIK